MLATASLELKAEKQSAHYDIVRCVAFSPDGSTIVSGSDDNTIKVWDAANPRPYIAAEWKKVEGDGQEDDEEADMDYPYWKNTVTGELRDEESTAGVSPSNRSKSGMQVP
jgi:WD40 repeat protein